ncbi:MAG: dioxygenase [Pseudomonadota bacterium]
MSNIRVDAVVQDIVEAVRGALRKNDVNFEEFRAAVGFLAKTAQAKEIPLMIDLFFNTTIVEIGNKKSKGSSSDLQGPYFLEDVPLVEDRIKTMEEFDGEPMLLNGRVKDPEGRPVEGAEIFVWSSTPDGKYSGFHDNIPTEYYRGKLISGANGEYEVESTVPVPYQIPHHGPTGELLEMMGRHNWRPAHVHYKIRKPGFMELTTQAYFEGGDYVGDDCADGMHTDEFVIPEKHQDGKRLMEIDFILTPVAEQSPSVEAA